jgi:hypothetical protein
MRRNRMPPDQEEGLNFAGGVNTLDHPLALQPNQTTRCANAFPNRNGILEKRPGVTPIRVIDATFGGSVLQNRYVFLHVPLSELSAEFVYFYIQDNDTAVDCKQYVILESLASIQVDSGTIVPKLCFVDYNGSCYLIGAFTTLKEGFYKLTLNSLGVNSWEAATFVHTVGNGVPDAQSQAVPVLPSFACVYRNRVRYFNFGPNMGHWMVSADYVKTSHTNNSTMPISTVVGTDVLSYNGRHAELTDIVGETIVAGGSISLQAVGNPIEAALLLLTEKSALICTGDITQTSDTGADDVATMLGDFVANKVNYEVGCCSPHTFVHTPYGYIWASGNDVWTIAGNAPVKIGTLIGRELTAYPESGQKFWTAAYADNKYILQCVSAVGADDRYLQRAQWWLDLTNGMPQGYREAKWFGPMEVKRDSPTDSTCPAPLSGIVTSRDGKQVVGVANTKGFPANADYSQSILVDYTSPGQTDDIPFPTKTGGLEWAANTIYDVFDVVRPPFHSNNGRLYSCEVGGTTGGSEPVWPDSDAGGVLDGTCFWREILGQYISTPLARLLNINAADEDFSVGIDVISKELIFKYAELDKILKRIELYAYSAQLQLLWCNIIKNQGAVGAYDLMYAVIGQGENQLRAGDSTLDSTPITHGQLEAKSLRPLPNTIVRGKSLQIRIRDGITNVLHPNTGSFFNGLYVIDDTCNKIVFGSFNGATIKLYQATIELSSLGIQTYGNIEALTAAVAEAMNIALTGVTSFNGFTIGPNPIYSNIPTESNSPYFNAFQLDFSARGSAGFALVFGNVNSKDLSSYATFGNPTTLFDLAKSRRLMAMMGFSTETTPGIADLTAYDAGLIDVFYSPECSNPTSATPATVYAKEITQYNRSAKIGIADGVAYARMTHTKPLTSGNR